MKCAQKRSKSSKIALAIEKEIIREKVQENEIFCSVFSNIRLIRKCLKKKDEPLEIFYEIHRMNFDVKIRDKLVFLSF